MALKLNKKNTNVKKVIKKVRPVETARKATAAASRSTAQLTYATGEYTEGVGRRKVATARVRLYQSSGDFIVNDLMVGEYFNTVPFAVAQYMKPFELTNTKGKFAVTAKISGSGIAAQLEALTLGISRALVEFDGSLRAVLKQEGLLSRDDRMKETRKIGTGGKARRKRQSPKR